MIYLLPPENKTLVWYLAMEEYVAEHIHQFGDQVLFTWIVDPTVIIGKHQVLENEVNLPYCRANRIAVYQRKSGGGCVYSDRGNLMTSFISTNTHAQEVFQAYLQQMVEVLSKMGCQATRSQNNDILVNQRKVSGNASYTNKQATVVHGTMLCNVNLQHMQMAITPSQEKLDKHGVKSVRQRVENLMSIHPELDLSTTHVRQFLMDELTERHIELTSEDIRLIDQIESTYSLLVS